MLMPLPPTPWILARIVPSRAIPSFLEKLGIALATTLRDKPKHNKRSHTPLDLTNGQSPLAGFFRTVRNCDQLTDRVSCVHTACSTCDIGEDMFGEFDPFEGQEDDDDDMCDARRGLGGY